MRSERGWLLSAVSAEAVVALGTALRTAAALPELLVCGPLLAACRLRARVTALLALAAALLAAVLPGGAAAAGSPHAVLNHAVRVVLVSAVGLWAVLVARGRTAAEAALARATRIAELTQRALARPLPTEFGGLTTAMHTASATPGALIGGDLYDAVLTPAGPRLLIGDVRGHGVDAALLGAAVLGAFRRLAATEPDLVGLARELDDRIGGDLSEEDFVTLLLADFTADGVRLVNCGHPPPLRVGRRLELLEPAHPSPPLGLSPRPSLQRVGLSPEQRLLLYTDGLTEARDDRGAGFPLDHRVRSALSAPSVGQALDGLVELLRGHASGRTHDDLTLILVQPTADLMAAPMYDDRVWGTIERGCE
ncbi:hypothetical protein BIV57_04660 [Mangrovactinospora gilvigrisea]|uniref:PPM-type phosphatase domain-containing protein n=1 Tax=Mangrovactinospora gilvigrisea TaxID=1428644 RepID=A0A1J7BJ28_9ACTN|nr:PP2C family protein-serine/threonine phosphatase [Mangrovactinospora gilvigrisea]OIV38679.1 hypothetical protein BIV57_04660 [Mangrovactinospora gilvigrisea]